MDFNLDYSAIVILHGIGGMTVSALRNDVPDVASKLLLDISFLKSEPMRSPPPDLKQSAKQLKNLFHMSVYIF